MATFKEAFASARKAGKKSFKWNGKLYTTALKEETKSGGSSPRPKPKPPTGKPPGSSQTAASQKAQATVASKSAPSETPSAGVGSSARPRKKPSWSSTPGGQLRIKTAAGRPAKRSDASRVRSAPHPDDR